jgi:AraC-like DNA-binding protein
MPELMVTEDRGFYCDGGAHARAGPQPVFGGEILRPRRRRAKRQKALLIGTPRAWQAGFAIVPLKTEHSDDAISSTQEWLHQNFHKTFPLDVPAQRVGMSPRNFVRRFKQATGDNPLTYLQKLRVAAAKRLLESDHRTIQKISERRRLSRCRLFPNDLRATHRGLSKRMPADIRVVADRMFGELRLIGLPVG